MSALGTLLVSIFGGLVSWLSTYVGKRIAVAVAVVTALGGALAAFVSAIQSAISSISVVAPPAVQVGLSMLPAETGTLLGILVTAETAAYTFAWLREIALAKAL